MFGDIKNLLLCVIAGLFAAALMFRFVTIPTTPNPATIAVMIILFSVAPVGAFWMMYMAIRYERVPWPLILLAMFVPFSFLWYYFRRVRPGKHNTRAAA